MLAGGKCLVLLDGYDEVPSSVLKSFETHLHHFIRSYHTLQIVLTSRPVSSFVSLQGFTVYEIMPFTKEQALTLIDKLAFHDRQAKEKFRKDLDARLYDSHYQFASNPLLLTIMLMTYSTYGNVPAKQHVFYAKAYETMAREHDATKCAYERPMHTKLTPEEFAAYFAEFCARTYRAELLEFTETSFAEYMNKVIAHRKRPIEASIRDFLKDLTDNLCLMYKEGEKYYFIHRSFQEYFTAVFFSTLMDDTLGKTGEFFEQQPNRLYGDRTFDMLYDMIPEKVDRHIFLPYLEQLWKKCDESRGYWTFLVTMYFTLYIHKGDTEEYRETDPKSYLYNFIFRMYLDGAGKRDIANKLNEANIPSLHGGQWCAGTIDSILKNEKYTGDLVLQKTYTPDHLSKKSVPNKRNVDMYVWKDNHEPIIEKGLFDAVQEKLKANTRQHRSQKKGELSELSGLIRCSICGKSYSRQSSQARVNWICTTYKEKGKRYCPSDRIPEETLKQKCKEVLRMAEYDAQAVTEQIEQIHMLPDRTLKIIMKNGSSKAGSVVLGLSLKTDTQEVPDFLN